MRIFRRALGATTALCFLATPFVSNAVVLDFEEIIPPAQVVGTIPNGYGGLNWDMQVSHSPSVICGLQHGLVSGQFVGRSNISNTAEVSTASGTFDVNGFYLTAACNDGLNVRVEGILGGGVVFDQTVVVNMATATSGPDWFDFNYQGIDTLRLTPSGGVDAGCCGGSLLIFALDDFTFNEPIVDPNMPDPNSPDPNMPVDPNDPNGPIADPVPALPQGALLVLTLWVLGSGVWLLRRRLPAS